VLLPPSQPSPRGEGAEEQSVKEYNALIFSPMGEIRKGVKNY